MEKFTGTDLIAKLIKRKKYCGKNPEEKDENDGQNFRISNAGCSKFIDSAKSAEEDDLDLSLLEIFSGYFLRLFPFASERWTNLAINFDSVLVGYEFDEMGMKFIIYSNRFR